MLKDYLRLHFIVLLWGFTAILGKLLAPTPAVELVFWRTGLAAAGLGLLLAARRVGWRVAWPEALKLLGVGALVAAHWITFFLAARLSSVSVCLAGLATLALWTSLLEPLLLWRRVRAYEVGLGLGAMLGLYLISQAELSQLTGLLVAVGSAGLSALFSVLNSQLVRRHAPVRLTFYEMAGAWLSIALFLPFYGRYLTHGAGVRLALHGYGWLWLGLLAGVCTVYAFSSSVELMKRLSAFVVNLTINLEPVYGILLAQGLYWLRVPGFGQERMAGGFYLGTVLILASVLVHPVIEQWSRRRARVVANS
ncbi:DMT family transporter [Hymenobacter caeli]|uniref:Drug/metabolite transporter (DMT)-like permease n=1 Tax=Hymenobacter caeli TaxID=2735894 RepID=A0ABX2FY50_9BACT|nr:DMT family transporter [Hymenobacter caeli]NRT21339.1 drug/metabolite transporter (DMT)-like permease [Hymenobacter caeli]